MGIGKLYKLVADSPDKKVVLDLFGNSIQPKIDEFDSMLDVYHEKLLGYLERRGIPKEWVCSATVSVKFEVEFEPKHYYWRSALGKPCDVNVMLHLSQFQPASR